MDYTQLKRLGRRDYADVWRLMLREDFPDTPTCEHEAFAAFADARLFGVRDADGLAVVLVFGQGCFGDDTFGTFLDVVCRADVRGRWATRRFLRAVHTLAFETLGVDVLYVEPRHSVAYKACVAAGFRPVYRSGVLVMRNDNFNKGNVKYGNII